jgi:hypothetical protein
VERTFGELKRGREEEFTTRGEEGANPKEGKMRKSQNNIKN